jgi:hypothetical protein
MKWGKRATLIAFATLFMFSCASSSVQKIGTANYAPLSQNADVLVYTSETEIKAPYEVIGIISYTNPGKYQILTLGDAIDPLKAKAREIGANAIILGQSQAIKSGFISTGITADARAIRLGN